GGKSAGFVLTILLVFAYYSLSLIGVSLAREARVPTWFGVWLANFVFFLTGAFLIWRVERRPIDTSRLRALWAPFHAGIRKSGELLTANGSSEEDAFERVANRRRVFFARFPMLLDDLVLRDFAMYMAMILTSFLILLLVFTLFELIGDILRNQISPLIVAEYLLNASPFSVYDVTPLP